ncbi:hypothetical protein HYPP_04184 [Hyphomicrobium sp. ghe19]|nr:hypothetical protein HYPP_04184 [Hyphomicrobium sp. ghe19]
MRKSVSRAKHKRTRERHAPPDVNPPASRTLFAKKGHVQSGGSVFRAVGMAWVWGKGAKMSTLEAGATPPRGAGRTRG